MKIISCKFFEQIKDFEEWQVKEKINEIINVSPFIQNGVGSIEDGKDEFKFEANMNVFVTYFKEVFSDDYI